MDAIEALRASVETATDLEEPWALFRDRLASSSSFMAKGVPKKSSALLEMIATTFGKALGVSAAPVGMKSIYVKQDRLWHGMCSLGGRPTVYFYFEDLELGLAGVMSSLTGGRVELIRFRRVVLSRPGWPGARAKA